jgi:hypothetical protein
VERDHPEISVRRQCELLGIGRAALYYSPLGESEENLNLMRLLDEQYTRAPPAGGLNQYGLPVGLVELPGCDLPYIPCRGLQFLHVSRYSLAQIGHQMIPIRHLYRGRSALSPAVGIQTGAIARDDLHSRMGSQPLREAFRRSLRQQIDDTALFQIQQHRSVAHLLAPSPIVHRQRAHRRRGSTACARRDSP